MGKIKELIKPFSDNKKLVIWEIVCTMAIYLMVHGYRLFNNMFSGDSMMMINQIDHTWQISIGRFMTPMFILLRGTIIAPWMVGILSMILLSLSAVVVCTTFSIQKKSLATVICALMASSLSLTGTYISFINNSDEFSFALLMAVFGAYLIISCDGKGGVFSVITGSLLLAISMGSYQAYVDVAIAVLMIDIFLRLTKENDIKGIFIRGLKYVAALLLAGGLYYALWKLIQKIFNIWTPDTYNGLANVGDFSNTSILGLIADTYTKVFNYFFNHSMFLTMTYHGNQMSIIWLFIYRLATVVVLVLLIYSAIKSYKENHIKWPNLVLSLLLLLLIPLGINFVNILSKGMEHLLMYYSFVMIFVLAVLLVEKAPKNKLSIIIICFCLGLTVWCDYVYSNQVYLKKQLQDNISITAMNRILMDIEDYPDYIPEKTPVAFIGTFEKSDYILPIEGLEALRPYSLGKTSMNYNATIYSLLRFNMSIDMKYSWIDPNNPYLATMPEYPNKGYIDMVDDILVVKISE